MDELSGVGTIQQINLKTFFKEKHFSIPLYQRGYSWEKPQRDDFLEDLNNAISLPYKHYMGTVVAIRHKDNITRYDIVDGQQRLTTIIILLARIIAISESNTIDKSRVKHNYLIDNTGEFIFTSGQQREILKEIIDGSVKLGDERLLRQDQNLIEAQNEFDEQIKLWDAENSTQDILKTLEENLGFILFVPEVSSVAGRMFEVINNRGKPLSELEKIKNYILYKAEEINSVDLKQRVEDNWKEILLNIQTAGWSTIEEEDEFLRACWLTFGSQNKRKSFHVYDSLKEESPKEPLELKKYLIDFIDFIKNSSRALHDLFCCREETGKYIPLHVIYERISHHPNLMGILPLILAIECKPNVSKDDKTSLLDILEKLNFRYYVAGVAKRNDTNHGTLFNLAHKYYTGQRLDDGSLILDETSLEKKLINFVKDNAPSELFKEKLSSDITKLQQQTDFYHWHGLKYFLARYEASLKDPKKSILLSLNLSKRNSKKEEDHIEREHIWAREMMIDVPVKYETIPEFNQKRLGNFTILSRRDNAKGGNKLISDKIDMYKKSEYLSTKKLHRLYIMAEKEISKYQRNNTRGKMIAIYTRFIDLIEANYINFALEEWAIDGEDHELVEVRVTF